MSASVSAIAAVAPQAWSGASMRTPPSQKMASAFDRIDSSGSGSISKSQLAQAFQTQKPPRAVAQIGVDAVWAKLDPSGSGSVAKQDFVQGMTAVMSQLRAQRGAAVHAPKRPPVTEPPQPVGPALYALNGLTGTSASNGSLLDASA